MVTYPVTNSSKAWYLSRLKIFIIGHFSMEQPLCFNSYVFTIYLYLAVPAWLRRHCRREAARLPQVTTEACGVENEGSYFYVKRKKFLHFEGFSQILQIFISQQNFIGRQCLKTFPRRFNKKILKERATFIALVVWPRPV